MHENTSVVYARHILVANTVCICMRSVLPSTMFLRSADVFCFIVSSMFHFRLNRHSPEGQHLYRCYCRPSGMHIWYSSAHLCLHRWWTTITAKSDVSRTTTFIHCQQNHTADNKTHNFRPCLFCPKISLDCSRKTYQRIAA